jgi:hypothetical protein
MAMTAPVVELGLRLGLGFRFPGGSSVHRTMKGEGVWGRWRTGGGGGAAVGGGESALLGQGRMAGGPVTGSGGV